MHLNIEELIEAYEMAVKLKLSSEFQKMLFNALELRKHQE